MAGLPTTERTLLSSGTWLESKGTYDARGRILTAQTPSDLENDPQTQTTWVYGSDAGLDTVAVTNAAGQSSKVWIDPAFGTTVKTEDANGLFTHFAYDAEGKLTAGWAPAQNAAEADGLLSDTPEETTVPTVSFLYDTNAPGLATRTQPIAVASAQFVGRKANGDWVTYASDAGSVRRSYTFYDGFGRPVQQQSVAPDGTGKRLVTATEYDDAGNATASYDAFVEDGAAQFSSGLVPAASYADYDRTEMAYDWAGRGTASTVYSEGIAISMSSTKYQGLVTVSEAATGATTTLTNDALGRTKSQLQASALDPTDTTLTEYNYEVLTAAQATAFGFGAEAGYSRVTVSMHDGKPTTDDTVFVSDLAGRRIVLADPNSGTTQYSYDDGGRVDSIENDGSGVIAMEYDSLGRLITRRAYGEPSDLQQIDDDGFSTIVDSNSQTLDLQAKATWVYDELGGVTQQGALFFESAWTSTPVGAFETTKTHSYDTLGRPSQTETALPASTLLGDLSGQTYTTSVSYDDLGQLKSSTGSAIGGLDAMVSEPQYDKLGRVTALEVGTPGAVGQPATGVKSVVTSVERDELGRLTSRTYGNGVVRAYVWDETWKALENISASFDDAGTAVTVQDDTYLRDAYGRVSGVMDGTSPHTAQCYSYDGFNRLQAARWVMAIPDVGICDGIGATTGGWPSTAAARDFTPATAYYAVWSYSPGGRIESLTEQINHQPTVEKTYAYADTEHPAAVTSVTSPGEPTSTPFTDTVSDDFESNSYAGGTGSRWSGDWVESQDDGSATDDAGLVYVANGLLHLVGSGVDFAAPGVSRTVDVSDADAATVNVSVLSGATALDASDVLTVQVTADGDPAEVITQELSGDSGFPVVTDETDPPVASVVPVDVSTLLPASSLTVSLFVDEGDATGNTTSTGQAFLIQDVDVVVSGSTEESTTNTDGFTYDGAGRMTERTVDGVVSTLTWDPMSNLVATDGPTAAGGARVYVYDASGQRVAQLQVK